MKHLNAAIMLVIVLVAVTVHCNAQDSLTKLYDMASASYWSKEYSFTISKDGHHSNITSNHGWNNDLVSIDENTAAIVHTHPYGRDPRPSKGDIDVARLIRGSNYVLSAHEYWVAEYIASLDYVRVRKVADVEYKHHQLVLHFIKVKGDFQCVTSW